MKTLPTPIILKGVRFLKKSPEAVNFDIKGKQLYKIYRYFFLFFGYIPTCRKQFPTKATWTITLFFQKIFHPYHCETFSQFSDKLDTGHRAPILSKHLFSI